MNLIYVAGIAVCVALLAVSLAVFPPLALIIAPALILCLQNLGVVPSK